MRIRGDPGRGRSKVRTAGRFFTPPPSQGDYRPLRAPEQPARDRRSQRSPGSLLIALAIHYWVEPAKSLPAFFPGHEAGRTTTTSSTGSPRCSSGSALLRLRLVPDRPAHADRGLSRVVAARRLISYGQAIVLGLLQGVSRALPDLEPRPQRDPPEPARLGHPPERRLLPHLPRRDAPGDRARPARLLLARLGADRAAASAARCATARSRRTTPTRKLGWLLVVGTIPAGILGLLLEHTLRTCSPRRTSAAFFLMLNGVLLYGAERAAPARAADRRRDDDDARIARSVELARRARRRRRAGARADPGLLALGRDDGRRPAGRALERGRGALRVPARDADHRRRRGAQAPRPARARRATACAGRRSSARSAPPLTAYLAVRFLMRFFETNRLTPFAVYCFAAGLACTIYFAVN